MVTIAPILENDLELVSRQLRRREFENELLGYRAILAGGASPTLAPISAAEAEDLMCLRDDDGKPVHNPDGIAAWQFDFSGSQHLSVLHALAPESDAVRSKNSNRAIRKDLQEKRKVARGVEP